LDLEIYGTIIWNLWEFLWSNHHYLAVAKNPNILSYFGQSLFDPASRAGGGETREVQK